MTGPFVVLTSGSTSDIFTTMDEDGTMTDAPDTEPWRPWAEASIVLRAKPRRYELSKTG